jgi:DNA topoisomerase VI subunit A
MVCSAGMPKHATRAFVAAVSEHLGLEDQIYGYSDCDADGLVILNNYSCTKPIKFGNTIINISVNVEWVGLRPAQIEELLVKCPQLKELLQTPTNEECVKIRNILQGPFVINQHKDRENQVTAMLNMKADLAIAEHAKIGYSVILYQKMMYIAKSDSCNKGVWDGI